MSLTGPRLEDPYAAGAQRRRWSVRRVTGWILIGIAIVYAVLLVDAAAGFVWWIRDDYLATDTFDYDAFEPLRNLILPGSFFVPRLVVDGNDIAKTGIYLGVVAAAQAGLIAALGWALVVRRWSERIAPGVVALVLVVVIAVVNVMAYEPELELPDRSAPAVQAEETRLAAVVAASDNFEGKQATCDVRLLEQVGTTSYVNTHCSYGTTETHAPARITASTVSFPTENRYNESLRQLFPREVRRALAADQADLRP